MIKYWSKVVKSGVDGSNTGQQRSNTGQKWSKVVKVAQTGVGSRGVAGRGGEGVRACGAKGGVAAPLGAVGWGPIPGLPVAKPAACAAKDASMCVDSKLVLALADEAIRRSRVYTVQNGQIQ